MTPPPKITLADAIAALREATKHPLPGLPSKPREAIAPLAMTTRQQVAALVAAAGHEDAEEAQRLASGAIRFITRNYGYIEAVAADLSMRVDIVTGEIVEPVAREDRAAAIAVLFPHEPRHLAQAIWTALEGRIGGLLAETIRKAVRDAMKAEAGSGAPAPASPVDAAPAPAAHAAPKPATAPAPRPKAPAPASVPASKLAEQQRRRAALEAFRASTKASS